MDPLYYLTWLALYDLCINDIIQEKARHNQRILNPIIPL